MTATLQEGHELLGTHLRDFAVAVIGYLAPSSDMPSEGAIPVLDVIVQGVGLDEP